MRLSTHAYSSKVEPNPMTGILLRRRIGYRHRNTQGEGHVRTEAKIRVMDLAAWTPRTGLQTLGGGKRHKRGSPRAFRMSKALSTA